MMMTRGRYVEEFSVSNFIGIDGSGAYCTPASPSILPSITNKMLMQIAADEGLDCLLQISTTLTANLTLDPARHLPFTR